MQAEAPYVRIIFNYFYGHPRITIRGECNYKLLWRLLITKLSSNWLAYLSTIIALHNSNNLTTWKRNYPLLKKPKLSYNFGNIFPILTLRDKLWGWFRCATKSRKKLTICQKNYRSSYFALNWTEIIFPVQQCRSQKGEHYFQSNI